MTPETWTLHDERRLARCCAASMTIAQLAIRLDRNEPDVADKLRQLGLKAAVRRRDSSAASGDELAE